MADISKIEWTDASWNPTTGCTKVSPGCRNCYADAWSKELQARGNPKFRNGFELTLHEKTLGLPYYWKEPKLIFVNSMSDLFHEAVPLTFIQRVFETMRAAHWHQYQILTKRSERLLELNKKLPWHPNVWAGVSVETSEYTKRIDDLRKTDARIKFLSVEPLLGPIPHLDLTGIGLVIVGGESGPKARPMDVAWALEIRDQCLAAKVAFFFKQFGQLSNNPDRGDPTAKENGGGAKGGRMLDGRIWDEMPTKVTR